MTIGRSKLIKQILVKKYYKIVHKDKLCNSREVNINRKQTDFIQLQIMTKEFQPFYTIWTSIKTFQKKSEEFKNVRFSKLNDLDVEEMNDAVKNIYSKVLNI